MRLLAVLVLSLLVAGSAFADKRWSRGDSHRWSETEHAEKSARWNSVRSEVKRNNSPRRPARRERSMLTELKWSNLNSGVCDGLMDATRGLRLMCMAFCELQDCQPDMALEDPFENCSKGSEWIFARYEARRGAGDPDMPCVKQPATSVACPCWTPGDLDTLRFPAAGESATCVTDLTAGTFVNLEMWQISSPDFFTSMSSAEGSTDGSTCNLVDKVCANGSCEGKSQYLTVTPGQFASCEADVALTAAARCP